jgi:polar amino acid transport system substrate-binding protein
MDQGYDLRVDFMPWSRAMVTIKKNRADLLIGAWYAEERNQYLLYSEPIFSSAIKFIKHIDSPFEYTGIKSLSGLRVGTILGYQYDADFVKANNFKKIHADNLIINIYNLLARRISLTLDDQYVLAHTLDEKIPNWRGKIALVSQPLSEKRIYLAMNRSHPHCLKIIAAFNKGLAAIKKNGRYDEIVQSYEL